MSVYSHNTLMTNMHDYIKTLEPFARTDDSMSVMTTARDMIMCLPSPTNAERDATLIPDVPVILILSTTPRLPQKVQTLVQASEDRVIFGDNELAGLCLNGRGMPPEIFLHQHLMQRLDKSGALFDEVAWHELVHGIEGIVPDGTGGWTRETPWSYTLQQQMIEIDRSCSHKGDMNTSEEKSRVFFRYLREGTELQQNVSEIFARASAYFMLRIGKDGYALMPNDMDAFIYPAKKTGKERDRISGNLLDLFCGLATYSEDAQGAFFYSMPEMIARISTLYGCKPV